MPWQQLGVDLLLSRRGHSVYGTRMLARRAFTLLEICLAISIGLLLLSMAIPSINGFVEQRKKQQSFERFDDLVRQARERSIQERRSFAISWDKEGLVLLAEDDLVHEVARLAFEGDEQYELVLPSALVQKPEAVWVFWPTGTCEPATVNYKGRGGRWTAVYNPLTATAELEMLQ